MPNILWWQVLQISNFLPLFLKVKQNIVFFMLQTVLWPFSYIDAQVVLLELLNNKEMSSDRIAAVAFSPASSLQCNKQNSLRKWETEWWKEKRIWKPGLLIIPGWVSLCIYRHYAAERERLNASWSLTQLAGKREALETVHLHCM